jgi:hypothetical protein
MPNCLQASGTALAAGAASGGGASSGGAGAATLTGAGSGAGAGASGSADATGTLNNADAHTTNEAVTARLHDSDFLNASSWIVGSPEPSGWKFQTSPTRTRDVRVPQGQDEVMINATTVLMVNGQRTTDAIEGSIGCPLHRHRTQLESP